MYDNAIPEQKPIVIIGGGLAGLACAYRLINYHEVNPSSILLLEAHTKLGGRVRQLDGFLPEQCRLELGAELLHGDETELVHLILENSSLHDTMEISEAGKSSTMNTVSLNEGSRSDKRQNLLLESFSL